MLKSKLVKMAIFKVGQTPAVLRKVHWSINDANDFACWKMLGNQ